MTQYSSSSSQVQKRLVTSGRRQTTAVDLSMTQPRSVPEAPGLFSNPVNPTLHQALLGQIFPDTGRYTGSSGMLFSKGDTMHRNVFPTSDRFTRLSNRPSHHHCNHHCDHEHHCRCVFMPQQTRSHQSTEHHRQRVNIPLLNLSQPSLKERLHQSRLCFLSLSLYLSAPRQPLPCLLHWGGWALSLFIFRSSTCEHAHKSYSDGSRGCLSSPDVR